ncbi:hypothetical protein A5792_28490 [Mycolicibacterium peregrinum]|uniref:PD-(D/E)XK motif protein n=1 Tax=Mycolicibacterium peregrinum TaxID=43304 RepID=A0A1A0QT42_MYCPR|nr:PD-(D/E)XK motif protein [Mycolicibacterium peregrinum]OBB25331.1 hypothetical protein A5792_28490 [Mycolicibacterium peregrinum]
MTTYEELLSRIGGLRRTDAPTKRNVHWLTDARVIGVSKTYEERIEIFLAGPKLRSSSPTLEDALEHQPWWRQSGGEPAFEANRMLLPNVGYFDQVAAFVCAELLRNGVDDDLEGAFRKTEPILALAIERLWLSDGAFLGLAGELLLLGAFCRCAEHPAVAPVVEAWNGWRPSLRDFAWGTVGIEVKTTTGSASTHDIQGTHQVELADGVGGGQPESALYLVSIGLQETVRHGNSFTVPDLVDQVVERLVEVGRADVADIFLGRVREYGSGAGFGYDHRTMRDDPTFARSFVVTFVRAYDMSDEGISVLRRPDVAAKQHVDSGSLRYSVELPAQISGDLNPVVGLNQTAITILRIGSSL